MPRALKETGQFKTDKKRIKGSGRYDWEKMRLVVKELLNDRPLDKSTVTTSCLASSGASESATSSRTGSSSTTRRAMRKPAPSSSFERVRTATCSSG